MNAFPQSLLHVQNGHTGTEIHVYPVGDAPTPPLPLMAVGQGIRLVDGTTYVILEVTVDEHRAYGDTAAFEADRAYYVWKYKVTKEAR